MSDFHEIASQKFQNLLHAWSMFPTGLGQEKGNHELSRPSPDYSHELSRSSPDYPHDFSMCSPAEYPHTFKLREQRHFGLFPIVFDVFTFFCLRLYVISVSDLISCSLSYLHPTQFVLFYFQTWVSVSKLCSGSLRFDRSIIVNECFFTLSSSSDQTWGEDVFLFPQDRDSFRL